MQSAILYKNTNNDNNSNHQSYWSIM